MTTAASGNQTEIRRCAVLKIDRKGRLIYLDKEAERLLGASQVALFGRPITDFLAPSDVAAIEAIAASFSHYETTFETSTVTMVDAERREFRATVIVSQNFAAGNPTNYQIIITPELLAEAPPAPVAPPSAVELLTVLASAHPFGDPQQLTDVIAQHTKARTVRLLDSTETPPTLLARTDTSAAETAAQAESRELSQTFDMPDGRQYELQAVCPLASAEQLQSASMIGVATVFALLHRLVAPAPAAPAPVLSSADTVYTWSAVSLLQQVRIGAALIDDSGDALETNRLFESFYMPEQCGTRLEEIVASLRTDAGETPTELVRSYLIASDLSETPPPLTAVVRTPSGRSALLTVIRLVPGCENRSCFLLLKRTNGETGLGHLSASFVRQAAGSLSASLDAATSAWQKLEHGYNNELTGDGCFYLQCLSNHFARMTGTVADLVRSATLTAATELPQTVDTGLLMDQLLAELATRNPRLGLSIKHANLPRIQAPLKTVTAVLEGVLSYFVDRARKGTVEIEVSSVTEVERCRLRISDNGENLSGRAAQKLFDYGGGSGGGVTGTLGLALELARAMRGDITLAPQKGHGLALVVTLPTGQ
jgi:hypothetical protein